MKPRDMVLSTGMPGLDRILQGLRPGDNVVWEVDGVEDYLPVLGNLASEARRRSQKLVYFRFARHAPLVEEDCGAEIHTLDPQLGFERFLTGILDVISRAGPGTYYIFDCLSDLAADWFSDRMLGNFFMITCPYLYELDTIAYFALQKNLHSANATQAIFETAQVVVEVYHKENQWFLQPLKVWQRYSSTMYMLHSWEKAEFTPVTSSATITDILASVPKPWLEFAIHRPGVWGLTFQEAQQALNALRKGQTPGQDPQALCLRLLRMSVTRDERFLQMARKYFDLADVVEIMQRMIGTGLIGGKSLGMLLARAILKRSAPRWSELLESHDSFYVGSDVFYTYLVQNNAWWLHHRLKEPTVNLQDAQEGRDRILKGSFPEYIRQQFLEMLEYFGQSPLIVRSSSLLEDNYGNAFSGKYESVFCANQGSPQERLEAFMNAVRTVYASAMSEQGLNYRQHHGLLNQDEQMALLVQRVSGELKGHQFYPHVAGVGFSFNPYVWHEDIDPKAGMLRLVFGLGTRAVERSDNDYTRLVALNAPLKRLEARAGEQREFTQRRVDVLDLQANRLVSCEFEIVARDFPRSLLEYFAAPDERRRAVGSDKDRLDAPCGYLTFERLFRETQFVPAMRDLCQTLQRAYDYPVDIEFTANFQPDGRFRINLVQCRPFQVKIGGEGSLVKFPTTVEPDHLLLQSCGPIIGHSLATTVHRLIYVAPSAYSRLSMSQRYSIARTIGRLTHLDPPAQRATVMLVGPGRWGTSTPSLGVPVSFAEINTVSILCELAVMHESLVPDVSLGTHFFNDLVEMDMLYLAVSPGREGHLFNEDFVSRQPNQLPVLLPGAREWAEVIRVLDTVRRTDARDLLLNVDSMKQRAICYAGSRP